MIYIPADCIRSADKRQRCVVKENGKTYTLENAGGVVITVIRVDGCVIQNELEKKCDFLMHYDHNNVRRVIFIELKGGALLTAVKQIYLTILHLRDNFEGYHKHARIIGSRDVPNIKNSPIYLKLKRELSNSHGAIQIKTNRVCIEQV